MIIKQITVLAENRRGGLKEITDLLADGGVDMKALTIADTKEFGIVRIIADNAEKAEKLLSGSGHLCKLTDVIGVKIPHRVGGLNEVLGVLCDAGVNVEYLYAFLSEEDGARVALRVTDNEKAVKALTAAGFSL